MAPKSCPQQPAKIKKRKNVNNPDGGHTNKAGKPRPANVKGTTAPGIREDTARSPAGHRGYHAEILKDDIDSSTGVRMYFLHFFQGATQEAWVRESDIHNTVLDAYWGRK